MSCYKANQTCYNAKQNKIPLMHRFRDCVPVCKMHKDVVTIICKNFEQLFIPIEAMQAAIAVCWCKQSTSNSSQAY